LKYLAIIAAVTIFGATSATACQWAGGTYKGNELNFRTEFSVNADCTEMVFQSSGSAGFQKADTPETFKLVATKKGWETEIHSVNTILDNKDSWVQFIGPGVNKRLDVNRLN
jgi:hypothetical protein